MSIATRINRAAGPAIGAATPERAAHAPDGIHEERLSHNEGHVRGRVRVPMQLFGAATNRLARELAVATGQLRPKCEGGEQPEPTYVLTRLDKALDTEDGRILRWALSRYVEDCILINMRGTGSESGKVDGSQAAGSCIPFNETQRRALARRAFVHDRVGNADRRDLQAFAQMMAPIDGGDAPAMTEFAQAKTGISDHRAQEGCFVGIMWKVAERLYEVYRLGDFPERIELGTQERHAA
jgi:hypothetical protein